MLKYFFMVTEEKVVWFFRKAAQALNSILNALNVAQHYRAWKLEHYDAWGDIQPKYWSEQMLVKHLNRMLLKAKTFCAGISYMPALRVSGR